MSLMQASLKLNKELKIFMSEVREEESNSQKKVLWLLDQLAFQNLLRKINLYAIDLLIIEWEAAKDLLHTSHQVIHLAKCIC